MTGEPDAAVERPKRMTRRHLAVILCILSIAAVPAVLIGYEMLEEVPCGCIDPQIERQFAP